jgi:hypothetical protein
MGPFLILACVLGGVSKAIYDQESALQASNSLKDVSLVFRDSRDFQPLDHGLHDFSFKVSPLWNNHVAPSLCVLVHNSTTCLPFTFHESRRPQVTVRRPQATSPSDGSNDSATSPPDGANTSATSTPDGANTSATSTPDGANTSVTTPPDGANTSVTTPPNVSETTSTTTPDVDPTWFCPLDGENTTHDGSKTTGDGSKTTGDGSKTTGDGSKTTGDGSKTTGDGSKTTGDGSSTTGDGSNTTGDIWEMFSDIDLKRHGMQGFLIFLYVFAIRQLRNSFLAVRWLILLPVVCGISCSDIWNDNIEFVVATMTFFFSFTAVVCCMINRRRLKHRLTFSIESLQGHLSQVKKTLPPAKLDDGISYAIMLSMTSVVEVLTEVKRGLWAVDVTNEKISIVSVITEINTRASDLAGATRNGKTYLELFAELSAISHPPDERL